MHICFRQTASGKLMDRQKDVPLCPLSSAETRSQPVFA